MTTKKKSEFKRGVEAAASLASEYDGASIHKYRLEDCILAKLNQHPRAKPRLNKKALQHPALAFVHGTVVTLAEMHRLGGDSSSVCQVARDTGLTLKEAKKLADPYDWKQLKKAGVK